jgi:predicted acetyltransferase
MPPETKTLHLVRPSVDYRGSFLSGLREPETDSERDAWVYLGDKTLLDFPSRDFEAYVRALLKREFEPEPHFVPDTTYWAVRESEVVGRISLRHELNEFLRTLGGHIGYVVRPTFRGSGIASETLR